MNKEDISHWQNLIMTTATEVGIKVLAAVAFWVIGRWLIGVAVGMVRASLERQKVDPTVLRYVGSIVTVTLNILLVIGILGTAVGGAGGKLLGARLVDLYTLFFRFPTLELFHPQNCQIDLERLQVLSI
jgi:small-conductance mechanosensitive channel